jgi:hypothetical protein
LQAELRVLDEVADDRLTEVVKELLAHGEMKLTRVVVGHFWRNRPG